MKDNYLEFVGEVVRVHLVDQDRHSADYVGRMTGNDSESIRLSPYTHFYAGDTVKKILERVAMAETNSLDEKSRKLVWKSVVLGKKNLGITTLLEQEF